MGITMEIYAADEEEFVSIQKLLASELTSEEVVQHIFDQLRDYPQANFSLQFWKSAFRSLGQRFLRIFSTTELFLILCGQDFRLTASQKHLNSFSQIFYHRNLSAY